MYYCWQNANIMRLPRLCYVVERPFHLLMTRNVCYSIDSICYIWKSHQRFTGNTINVQMVLRLTLSHFWNWLSSKLPAMLKKCYAMLKEIYRHKWVIHTRVFQWSRSSKHSQKEKNKVEDDACPGLTYIRKKWMQALKQFVSWSAKNCRYSIRFFNESNNNCSLDYK